MDTRTRGSPTEVPVSVRWSLEGHPFPWFSSPAPSGVADGRNLGDGRSTVDYVCDARGDDFVAFATHVAGSYRAPHAATLKPSDLGRHQNVERVSGGADLTRGLHHRPGPATATDSGRMAHRLTMGSELLCWGLVSDATGCHRQEHAAGEVRAEEGRVLAL